MCMVLDVTYAIELDGIRMQLCMQYKELIVIIHLVL